MPDTHPQYLHRVAPSISCFKQADRHFYAIILYCVICLSLTAGIATALADPTPLTKREEGQIYDQAIHILGGNANVISKWVGDIRFAIIGHESADFATLARATLADVAAQTGLPLIPVKHSLADPQAYVTALEQSPPFQLAACTADTENIRVCANFVVLFSGRETMQAVSAAIPLRPVYQRAINGNQDIPCFFAPFQTRAMVIDQAFVFVNQELPPAMVRTCLQEEIYQSFGLFNDFSGSTFFSFNNKVEPKPITSYDRALLTSVYDVEIKPGAPVWRVMERLMENLGIDPFTE